MIIVLADAKVFDGDSEAMSAWQQLADDPRAFHIESEPLTHEHRFSTLVIGREPTPNLWTDAWLAALALSLDYEMTTFDRGFKSFRGLRVRLLSPPDR
jgi:uncharacterized protein